MIEISKIKPGDLVTIRGVVSDCRDGNFLAPVAVTDSDGNQRHVVWLESPATIISIEPKALCVGDRVKVNGDAGPILALSGGFAWVSLNHWPVSLNLARLRSGAHFMSVAYFTQAFGIAPLRRLPEGVSISRIDASDRDNAVSIVRNAYPALGKPYWMLDGSTLHVVVEDDGPKLAKAMRETFPLSDWIA